jgi:capsid protein
LDLFTEQNDMMEVEKEAIQRLHAEGEFFLRLFPQSNGLLTVRFVEPELVKSPVDDTSDPSESFGIKCHPDDLHTVLGYYIVEKPWEDPSPVLVPADEIIHVKLNTESNAKRGLPTVYPITTNLRDAEENLKAMIALCKVRAKVGMVRRVNDATPEAVRNLEATAATGQATDQTTGRTYNINKMPYGAILTSSGNVEYEFPTLGAGATDLIEVFKVNLRAIAARFGISEIMLTADAGGANYASSLTAEAPATKTFEHFQTILSKQFGTRRLRPKRSLCWHQLNLAVEHGLIDPKLLPLIRVDVQAPTVTPRNKAEESQVHKTYVDMGAISIASVRGDIGKDDKSEQEQIDRERRENQAKNPQPPGGMNPMGGQTDGGKDDPAQAKGPSAPPEIKPLPRPGNESPQ